MKTAFKASFLRDVQAIKERQLLSRIKEVIESVESANSLAEVRNLKSLKGGKNVFRIRVGDYRLGLVVDGEMITFVRCLHRREIYRYFP